jgi:hypothetical protein
MVQLLVEYRFLIYLQQAIREGALSGATRKPFRRIFETLSRQPDEEDDDTVDEDDWDRFSLGSDYQSDDQDYGSTSDRYSVTSSQFGEYYPDYKYSLTVGKIDRMLSEVNSSGDPDLLTYERFYEQQLLDTTCDPETATRHLGQRELASVWDAKNYSLYVLLRVLQESLEVDPSTDNYLVYCQDEKGIFAGHVFIHHYRERMMLEAISIQISLDRLLESTCQARRAGLSVQLFRYILEQLVPPLRTGNRINYLYAHAWPTMSSILKSKFGFSTLQFLDWYQSSDRYDEGDSYHRSDYVRYSDQDGWLIVKMSDGTIVERSKPSFSPEQGLRGVLHDYSSLEMARNLHGEYDKYVLTYCRLR